MIPLFLHAASKNDATREIDLGPLNARVDSEQHDKKMTVEL